MVRTSWLALVLALLAACGGAPGGGESGASAVEDTATEETPTAGQEPESDYYLGKPLADVERYVGLYGDPASPEEGRGQFFVTEAKRPAGAEQAPEIPPGYLAIGAMWADVAPMNMQSLSESRFEQVDLSSFPPEELAVAEFEFGADGTATALTFTSGSGLTEFGRRERLGDLPEEWR